MDRTDICKLCEKLVITLETEKAVKGVADLPNTYDPRTKTFAWKFHEFMAYALIPRLEENRGASAKTVDLYLCVDEDDLDDIDLHGFAKKFLAEKILPDWKHVRLVQLSKPVLAHDDDLECRKAKVYEKIFKA